MTPERYLVIFAKEPRMGRVKTRLARDIGKLAALRFYRGQLYRLAWDMSGDPRWRTILAVAPDRAAKGGGWPQGIPRIPQGGGDLGARMQRVFDRLPPGPAVIVGTDIPGITRDHIAEAFEELGRRDAVLGPAEDGGYWLIGLKRRPSVPRPFANVRWSGPHAMADTIANLKGRRIAKLSTLNDVDTGDDLARLQSKA